MVELHEKTYRASPLRRKCIKKANGMMRPLGIPTVKDRVVQCAVKIIIEPIFEVDFHDCSYGFRPNRSAQDAETMDLLGASPCVIAWAPYNEGGAQPWSVQTHATLAWTKRRDPTRLVDAPSGWVDFDGGGRFHLDPTKPAIAPTAVAEEMGDFIDMHHYPEPSMRADKDRISFLGEWGGIGLKVPGHLWAPDAWGHCEEPTAEAFEKRYLGMVRMLEDLAAKGLSGSVYTQATDCEREANGLITYDRRVPKVNLATVRDAHMRVLKAVQNSVPVPVSGCLKVK